MKTNTVPITDDFIFFPNTNDNLIFIDIRNKPTNKGDNKK